MKTPLRALVGAIILLVALPALGQTAFPQPGENIWIDASKILYGVMPITTLGTNGTTATAGSSLQFDGSSLFWAGDSLSNAVPISYVSNVTILDSITIYTNVTVNNNISVSGKATVNYITVTNQLYFTTNAFPLSSGSTWNFVKPYQFITTNNDFAITAISGVSNNLINWAVLEVSNSAAATHFCDLSSLPWHIVGTSSTNKVYIGSGKVAIISANLRGLSSSNLVTAVEQ